MDTHTLKGAVETWECTVLWGSGKDKFSLAERMVSRCRHERLFFLFPLERGRRQEKKKGKLNPHLLSLLKGPGSKPEMKLHPCQKLAASDGWGDNGASQPACPKKKGVPPERIGPRFPEGLCIKGSGGDAAPWAEETKRLGMATSVQHLGGMIPPSSVHVHAEATVGQA